MYRAQRCSSAKFNNAISKRLEFPFLQWLQTAMEMACENEHSTIINLLLNEQEKVATLFVLGLTIATINGK